MKIIELLEEKQELDELSMAQVGSAIGKGATAAGKGIGATASGAVQAGKNFWSGLKQGWKSGQQAVAGQPDNTAAQAAPAGGQAGIAAGGADNQQATPGPAAGQGTAGGSQPSGAPAANAQPTPTQAGPTAGQGQTAAPAAAGQGGNGGGAATASPEVNALKQQIDKLDPASKKELLTTLQKSAPAAKPNTMANAPVSAKNTAKPGNPNAAQQNEPATEPEQDNAAGAGAFGQMAQQLTKAAPASTPAAKRNPNNPDDLGFGFDGNTGLPFKSQAEREAGLAKEKAAAAAAPAAAPAAQEPGAGKPSPEEIKQAQLKKDLLKKQQARSAGQTQPSGFAASGVGQARQRTYAGAGGAPKSYVVRENVGFYSKFLGQTI